MFGPWRICHLSFLKSTYFQIVSDSISATILEINDLYTRIVAQAMKVDFEICFVTKQIEKELSIFLVTRITRLQTKCSQGITNLNS